MNSNAQFETIVNAHYEALFRFAMSLTRMESDAQDLTQQTFYVWATKGHQLRDISKVKTWLFTTLHRLFFETRRRQNRFVHQDESEGAEPLPAESAETIDSMDRAEVLGALAKVDEIYQAAVALFYLEDCPYKEIAVILGVPVGTVKSRIARGIAQLRQIIKRNEFHDPSNKTRNRSPASVLETSTVPQEIAPPDFQRRAQLVAEAFTFGCIGWGISATCLGEPSDAATVLASSPHRRFRYS